MAYYQNSVRECQQQSDEKLYQYADMETLAQRLIRLRLAKGFKTQQKLASAAGLTQSFIGALEAGNQKTSKYLPEIAKALGVDTYYLKTGADVLVAGDKKIDEVVKLMNLMSNEGKAIVLHEAKKAAKNWPKPQETAA